MSYRVCRAMLLMMPSLRSHYISSGIHPTLSLDAYVGRCSSLVSRRHSDGLLARPRSGVADGRNEFGIRTLRAQADSLDLSLLSVAVWQGMGFQWYGLSCSRGRSCK